MRKVLLFLVGMLFGAGLTSAAFNYHVVHTSDGLIVVPRKHAGLVDLYADVRNWKSSDWQAHPELVRSLVARGRGDVVSPTTNEFLHDLIRKFDNAERLDEERQLE